MKNVQIISHPLMQHKLGYLRDKNTHSAEFREIMKEIGRSLAYEAMRDWQEMDEVAIETPIAKTNVQRLKNPPIAVSVMRAGNGLLDAVLSMIPVASAGFIGIYRDKFIHNTVEYYFKLPANVIGKRVLLCDPLIATADTMVAAIDRLKSYQVGTITVLSVLVSEHALQRYLVPGLGDAGDRLYQTK
jgi:uracil phosphoribosyltransferase